MTIILRLIAGALLLSNLLAACAASGGQYPQYSELEKCTRSGGTWRAGACEAVQASGGGY